MRIATFNILHGRSMDDGRVDLDRLRACVAEIDADILALQEVDRDQPRSQGADLTAVAAEAMGAVAHRFVAALSGTPGATWMAATGSEQPGTASYGIALLSRYPARDWQVIRLPRIPVRVPLWLPGPRRMALVKEEPRAAVVGRLDTPLGPLAVANTHLSFLPGWNAWQLRGLRRDLAVLDEPLLLLGDLNAVPPQPEAITGYRSLGAAATFPVQAPVRQLDHVLLKGQLPGRFTVSAPRLALSDHRPLIIDVT